MKLKLNCLTFILPPSAFILSSVESVEAAIERDELAVRVIERAALDCVLDGVEPFESREQSVGVRALVLSRFERACRRATRARQRGERRRALPLPQVDFDLGDSVAREFNVRVALR